METKMISLSLYVIALILSAIGAILGLMGVYGYHYGSILFVYIPICLIALGLILPTLLKE